ncbi:MAG: hypothetical protein U9O86_02995 [Campylobacterota bacterium]|nr:hypothetical protein [Campylobacterota bacterium]
MIKNIVKIVGALVIASSLFAGTAGGGSDGRLMSTAYFDVHSKSQAPMLDYIKYSKRASFDVKQYIDTVSRIKDRAIDAYIHGRVIVPQNITTEKVYITVGPNYRFSSGYWAKNIYYNGSKTAQNAEYFLVTTKKDEFGNSYVDYKITLDLTEPWVLKVSEKNVAPNSFFFSMAPKTRGFKNKFEKCDIYVLDE